MKVKKIESDGIRSDGIGQQQNYYGMYCVLDGNYYYKVLSIHPEIILDNLTRKKRNFTLISQTVIDKSIYDAYIFFEKERMRKDKDAIGTIFSIGKVFYYKIDEKFYSINDTSLVPVTDEKELDIIQDLYET